LEKSLSNYPSTETIDIVNKQIKASEKQAQEALYNQHKPIIVPIYDLIKAKDAGTFRIGIQNKGAGVALNAFGVMGIKNVPVIFCSSRILFLVPDKEQFFTFEEQGEVLYPFNVFEEVNVFPQVLARLMVTYNDAFSNKYFAVFDFEELGWKQVYEIRRVKQRLDELVIIRHKDE